MGARQRGGQRPDSSYDIPRDSVLTCTPPGLARKTPFVHDTRKEPMTNELPRRPATTTDAGIPVASQELSLTIGPDGPILLQDFYLIEQMAKFNRERIAERQPHAKGGSAFGTFVVTHDVSRYTKAAVFQLCADTDLIVRFSTVAGERG